MNVHTAGYRVNAEGYREILGLHVTSTEDVAGWLAFVRTSRPPAWGRVGRLGHLCCPPLGDPQCWVA